MNLFFLLNFGIFSKAEQCSVLLFKKEVPFNDTPFFSEKSNYLRTHVQDSNCISSV